MTSSFVALDFEIANAHHTSVCSVGVVRVRDGKLEEPRHWFCRPGPPYNFLSARNADITGIKASDLRGARGFEWLGPFLVRNIGDVPVVCHGAKSADLSMFEQSWLAAGLGPFPSLRYACTLEMARRLHPNLPKHSLDALSRSILGETMVGHHRADADAYTTARIALALLESSGTDIERWARTHRPKPGRVLPPARPRWGAVRL